MNFCKCGCKTEIKTNRNFVSGHNRRGAKNTNEHNMCISKANKGRKASVTALQNMSKARKGKPNFKRRTKTEIRTCKCGCGETFECKITSKKMYFKSGHHTKGKVNFHRKRTNDEKNRISKKMKQNGYKGKTLKERYNLTGDEYNILRKNISVRILKTYASGKFTFANTKPHRLLYKAMVDNKIWDSSWKNEYIFKNYYSIDIACEKKKIAIFVDGDYWHANPNFYEEDDVIYNKRLAKNIWKKDATISRFIKQNGWHVLRFWEFDIYSKIADCINKIKTLAKLVRAA